MTTIFVNDVGTDIILNCGVDISTATVRKIRAKNPLNVVVEWVAVASGIDSIKYTLQTGDVSIAGLWKLQAYVEMPGWKGRGTWADLVVAK